MMLKWLEPKMFSKIILRATWITLFAILFLTPGFLAKEESIFYPGDVFEFELDHKPDNTFIINPNGEKIDLEVLEESGKIKARYNLNGSVVLGEYILHVNNSEIGRFIVDFCDLKVNYTDEYVEIEAKTFFSEPLIRYYIDNEENASKGVLKIDLPEEKKNLIVICGSTKMEVPIVKKKVELKNLYFPSDTVEIFANFEPVEAYIIDPSGIKHNIHFSNGKATFELKKEVVLGKYVLFADGIEKEFYVDFCSINASYEDGKVKGKVNYNFLRPEKIYFTFENTTREINLLDDEFEIKATLPVNIKCGASELLIEAKKEDKLKRVEDEFKFDFEVPTGDVVESKRISLFAEKGKIENIKFEDGMLKLKLKGKSKVRLSLPTEISNGLHYYLWKSTDRGFKKVDYEFGKDRKELILNLYEEENIKINFPKYKVESFFEGKSGTLKVFSLDAKELYEIKVEIDRGNLTYLALVESSNLIDSPAVFPYELVKFRIDDTDESTVRIIYPSLEGFENLSYYKFNPVTLSWKSYQVKTEGSAIILKIVDNSEMDLDPKKGTIEDDGGIGWVGFYGNHSASICRDGGTNQVHTYWLYISSGDTFRVSIYDGDSYYGGSLRLDLRLYYPNGTQYGTFTASSDNAWDHFTINTYGQYGWWRLDVFGYNWPATNGNYYGLNVSGNEPINMRVNTTNTTGGVTYYGTPNSIMLDVNNPGIFNQREFWINATRDYRLAIYDPDSGINIQVFNETGALILNWNPTGNNAWNTSSVLTNRGWTRVLITQTANFDDYTAGGNHIIFGVNLTEGLFFKRPNVTVVGRVLEDFYPLGRNNGEDVGIPNVRVLLYEDVNRNEVLDVSDRVIATNSTNSTGHYILSAIGFYEHLIVLVDSLTVNTTRGLNAGYTNASIWAEQTYQTEWNVSKWEVVSRFGGRDPNVNNDSYIAFRISNYTLNSLDFGFSFEVVVNMKDVQENPTRYCQGCLRQFVMNANAIAGTQRSYFVMMVGANGIDTQGSWWRINLNSTLGSLNFTDIVEFNGTVLKPNMEINDTNPNCLIYDYETGSIKTVACVQAIPVGAGIDAIPFSGDEAVFHPIKKVELEIYGGNVNPIINVNRTANNSMFSNFSIFGSITSVYPGGISCYANNTTFDNILSGLRANGSDPKNSGLNRIGGAGFWIEGNNSTVRNSIVAFAERYGLLFYNSSNSGIVENVLSYRNGILFSGGDNFGAEFNAYNITFERCISAFASANGIETNGALREIRIRNCTIEYNSIGNETGVITETAGIRIHANHSLVEYNLIRNNHGHAVLVASYTKVVFNVTVSKNSIYNNSKLGLDLTTTGDPSTAFFGDNVTLNDGLLNCSQSNCGMDYPVITYAELDKTANKLYVEGFIGNESIGGSTAFSNARVEIYFVRNSTMGDNLRGNNWSLARVLENYYGEGFAYIGELTANATGYFSGEISCGAICSWIDTNTLISAITTLNGNTSEFGPNYLIKKRVNLKAGISISSNFFNITVTALEKVRDVRVYWVKPENITISPTGNYDESGNYGNIYWWLFKSMNQSETKYINMTVYTTGGFSMLETVNLGLDPCG